jgi:hypothetical protein
MARERQKERKSSPQGYFIIILLLLLLFLVVLGFEFTALAFAKQVLCQLSHSANPFLY